MDVVIQTSRDFSICTWIIVQLYALLHGDQMGATELILRCLFPWKPWHTYPGAGGWDESSLEPNQAVFHVWFPTSEQVQKSHRHLEVWPAFYSSIGPPILKVSLRRSGTLAFLGCKMGAMKLRLMFLLVIQCLEDTEIFTLRYRTRLSERRKGSICCHFMRWSTQPDTRIRTIGSIWVKKAGLSALR